jgi:hypothetical protein
MNMFPSGLHTSVVHSPWKNQGRDLELIVTFLEINCPIPRELGSIETRRAVALSSEPRGFL